MAIDGRVLASAGINIGQQIGKATEQFGQNVGGMLTDVGRGFSERRSARDAQQLLQQYANDPAQLNALGQKYATEGNDALSKVFFNAAERAQAVFDKKSARIDSRVAEAKERRDALIEGRAATDEAFGEAVTMRRALLDAKERAEREKATDKDKELYRLLKTRAITPNDYAKEVLKEDKKGSETKGYKEKAQVLRGGKLVEVVSFYEADGTFLGERVLGEVAADEDEADQVGRANWKGPDKEAYTLAVNEQRSASAEAVKYDSLLAETIDIASGAGEVPLPVVGGVLGLTSDFVISDVAGLGDAITVHRARLNEVRMQNAIALLPRGPASDRDVKLALDASVDPKNLSPEDRVRYIRGMKKLADAEKEYMDGKLRWIEQTGDALAFGYERKVSLDGYGKRIDALRLDNSAEVIELDKELQKVSQLDASGDRDGAKELLDFVKTTDTIGYIDLLQAQAEEQKRYDTFIEANNINFY